MIQAFLPRKLNGPYNARIMNASHSINDETRQRYLAEMGITVYFPRRPLPGAAASRRYPAGRDAVAEREPSEHEPQRAGPESCGVPAGLGGLKDSLSVDPPAAPSPAPATERQRSVAAPDASETLAFRFTWFRPDDRLGVIAGHTAARLPAQFLQMLQRILAALSPQYRDIALQGEPFHWPLDAAMPGDVDTARQVVRAFLRRRCGGAQPRFTLVLMDEAPVWLFPPDAGDTAATMFEPVPVPGRTEQILRVPALETMARDASAKRPAWEAMQSLIRPLAQCDRD